MPGKSDTTPHDVVDKVIGKAEQLFFRVGVEGVRWIDGR
jgi:hypothetical protein